jgi:ATP-dependent DNA helicase RecG
MKYGIFGDSKLETVHTFAKNPPISKVFCEIGLADGLGSGMRNTYKYTKLYFGGVPDFEEGDIFKAVIPLHIIATEKVGPSGEHETTHETTHDADRAAQILAFCEVPRTRTEIQEYLSIRTGCTFRRKFLRRCLILADWNLPCRTNSKTRIKNMLLQ